MANKKGDFKEKWNTIKYPFFILVGWAILNAAVPISEYLNPKLFLAISWTINLGAFGYVGYLAIKLKKDERVSAKLGIMLGIFTGLVAAIVGIMLVYLQPEELNELIQLAISQGKDPNIIKKLAYIGLYLNLILSPLISAIVGGFIAWMGALVSKIAIKKK